MDPDYISAHRHSIRNRTELEQSELCGCFYCKRIFRLSEAPEAKWINDDGDQALLCPYCEIDSVIGSASGYAITEDLLAAMRRHWFY